MDMNRLPSETRQAVIAALVEGNSIRATCRMTGVAKGTVLKLLVDLGTACSIHMDRDMRELTCRRIQCDEIWSFCYSKQKNVPRDKRGEAGDVWTWVAMDADTKLVPTYHVGPRDLGSAIRVMTDLSRRLRDRVQLTTDGFPAYATAVSQAFGRNVDYAQQMKQYAEVGTKGRYSPPRLIAVDTRHLIGNPSSKDISTSYIERQNLTMRMSMRRFTRLTNGFSKKLENLAAAVSLHFAHYNYCRPHKSLGSGVTPAMAAGIADHVWTLGELIGLLEQAERVPIKRGKYKPRQPRSISN
jgi:IS1 family transposase